MNARPTYHFRKKRHRRRNRYLQIIGITLFLLLVIGLFFIYDILRNQSNEIEGSTSVVTQSTQIGAFQKVDEPTYTIELPDDWKETDRFDRKYQKGVTWQSTREKEADRWLTIYVDKLPTNRPLNRIVPLAATGGGYFNIGNLSDECASFTQGGSYDAAKAIKSKPTLGQWEEVDFLCNLPRPFENEVGTASKQAVNSVSVKGPKQGKHDYFFLYTDHNNQANYQIFLEALKTFQAK